MALQDSDNCGRNFAKRKQSDAEFAGNRLLRMVIIYIYIVINTILGRLTLDPAGMHCHSWDDAFVSNFLVSSPSVLDMPRALKIKTTKQKKNNI